MECSAAGPVHRPTSSLAGAEGPADPRPLDAGRAPQGHAPGEILAVDSLDFKGTMQELSRSLARWDRDGRNFACTLRPKDLPEDLCAPYRRDLAVIHLVCGQGTARAVGALGRRIARALGRAQSQVGLSLSPEAAIWLQALRTNLEQACRELALARRCGVAGHAGTAAVWTRIQSAIERAYAETCGESQVGQALDGHLDWEILLCVREVTLEEALSMATLSRREDRELPGGDEMMEDVIAMARADNSFHLISRSAAVENFRASAAARELAGQLFAEARGQKRADDQTWSACAGQRMRAPALDRVAELKRELDAAAAWLADARRSTRDGPLGDILAGCVRWGRSACETALAIGGQSAAKEIVHMIHRLRLVKARKPHINFHPGTKMSWAAFEKMGGGIDKIFDRTIADMGREAAKMVDIFWLCQAIAEVTLYPFPEDTVATARSLMHQLGGAEGARLFGSAKRREALLRRVREAGALAAHIDLDARADGLMARRVRTLTRRGSALFAAHGQLKEVRLAVEAARDRARGRAGPKQGGAAESVHRPRPVPPEVPHVSPLASPRDFQSDREAPSSGQRGDDDFLPVGTTPSRALLRATRRHFDPGSFASPWRSACYHFSKHAEGLPGATLGAYIGQALAARGAWADALARGEAYLGTHLARPSERVRIISTSALWLVTTDEDDPKILSYRDRRRLPYA